MNLIITISDLLRTGVILLLTTILFGCSPNVEKTVNKYCQCLEENEDLTVNEKINKCEELLTNAYHWSYNKEQILKTNRELDSLLTQTCSEYVRTKKFLKGDFGDWIILNNDMTTDLAGTECEEFRLYSNFYYLESNGDTVLLTIKDGIWKDSFLNGKFFSYLDMKWISPCEFEIIMMETTEPNRKAVFKKGDVFKYKIIDKKEGHFVMTVSYKDSRQQFILYCQ